MKKILLMLLLLVAGVLFAQSTIPQGTTSPIINSTSQGTLCTDSDNGLNPNVAGIVTSGGQTYNDSCASLGSVREYYCANNAVGSTNINCQIGTTCQNAQCVYTFGTTGQQATVTPQNNNSNTSSNQTAYILPPDPTVYQQTQVQTPSGGFDSNLLLCGGAFLVIILIAGAFIATRG